MSKSMDENDGAVSTTRRPPWGCSGCTRRWSSLSQAHCASCHEQFATVGVSDKHRHDGVCMPPAQARTPKGQRVYRLSEETEGPVWRSYQRNMTYERDAA